MLGDGPGKPFKEYYGKRHETSFASVSGAAFGMENGIEEVARVHASGAVDLQSGTSGKPQWSGASTSDDGSHRDVGGLHRRSRSDRANYIGGGVTVPEIGV